MSVSVFMISRKHRFHGHRSVSRVRGGRFQLSGLRAVFSRNSRDDYRMAVVVSKKISKSAVKRNRIRRRLYESVRKQQLLDGQNVDLVLIVQDDTFANIPATEIDNYIAKICQKILSDKANR